MLWGDGILPFPPQVRRWGIAGCVRNCCFEELDHPWLLHEVKVVPHLLMRLADEGDVYDFDEKVRGLYGRNSIAEKCGAAKTTRMS